MTATPRIARVEILWSENGSVPTRTFTSMSAADAALARAFKKEPPPSNGAYDKTGFRVVWTDGHHHEGRLDVTAQGLRTSVEAGGLIRQHLHRMGLWLRDRCSISTAWTEEERAQRKAAGIDLLARLEVEPLATKRRNLTNVGDDHLLPVGSVNGDVSLTLLPDPLATAAHLEATFAVARPAVAVWMGGGRTVPRTTNRDVRRAANWITLALANDLPRLRELTGRAHGTVWDRWAKTIEHVQRHLGADPDAPYRDNQNFWSDQVQHLAHKVAAALARNGDSTPDDAEAISYRITSRDPRGEVHVTYHSAVNDVSALRAAKRYLGYTPDVLKIQAQADDGQWWPP